MKSFSNNRNKGKILMFFLSIFLCIMIPITHVSAEENIAYEVVFLEDLQQLQIGQQIQKISINETLMRRYLDSSNSVFPNSEGDLNQNLDVSSIHGDGAYYRWPSLSVNETKGIRRIE